MQLNNEADIQHKYIMWATLLVFVLALRPIEAFDTFWQLQSGKYIWQTKEFIYRDTFSLAQDNFRPEHCWLHDIVLYALYSLGGYTLLGLIKPLIIAACSYLLMRWHSLRNTPGSITILIVFACLYGSAGSWLARPQLWTFLGGVAFLILLHKGRESGWRSWLWLTPIMLVWANMHAGCIFGFALFAAFYSGEVWRCFRGLQTWRYFALLNLSGVLMFAAAFINPYGWRIPLGEFMAHVNQAKIATGDAVPRFLGNMEWLPPTFEQVPLFYLIMLVWAATIVTRLVRKQMDVAELAYFAGFCYMGFSQIRHTTLVALMAAFFLPGAIAQLTPRTFFDGFLGGRKALLAGMFLIMATVAWAGFDSRLGTNLAKHNYPVAAAEFVKEHKPPGNLYNAYDWGGYLMWRLYPDYLMFVDGRSGSSHYFQAATQIEYSLQGWVEVLADENVNLIITRTCFYDSGGPQKLIDSLARRRDWVLVFQDETAVVYVRNLEANRELIRRFGMPNHYAYRTMLAEATRLQAEGYPRPRAWLALGRANFALGNRQEAMSSYRKFLKEVPDDREAQTMIKLLSRGRS